MGGGGLEAKDKQNINLRNDDLRFGHILKGFSEKREENQLTISCHYLRVVITVPIYV